MSKCKAKPGQSMAVITIRCGANQKDGEVDVTVEFDPPMKNDDTVPTAAQSVATTMLSAFADQVEASLNKQRAARAAKEPR